MKITPDNPARIPQVSPGSSSSRQPGPQTESGPPSAPGREVTGEVIARLSEEAYLVKIGDGIYRTELPMQLKPGEQLRLVYNSSEPRPSFTLRNPASDAEPVRISPAAARFSTLAAETPADRAADQTRFIGRLIESPPTDPHLTADALRNALTRSGLFYESHLVRWLQGERLLADLLKEPQGRFSPLLKRARRFASPSPSLEDGSVSQKGDPVPASAWGEEERQGLFESIFGINNQEIVSIVRDQLSALLSGMARLHGEAWPGQELEWDVERSGDETGKDAGSSWRTRLRLRLPRLGFVNATIIWSAGGIRGEIKTEEEETAKLLESEVKVLEQSMAASGLRLLELVVGHERRE